MGLYGTQYQEKNFTDVPIDEIKPHPDNPRIHGHKSISTQSRQVTKSLESLHLWKSMKYGLARWTR